MKTPPDAEPALSLLREIEPAASELARLASGEERVVQGMRRVMLETSPAENGRAYWWLAAAVVLLGIAGTAWGLRSSSAPAPGATLAAAGPELTLHGAAVVRAPGSGSRELRGGDALQARAGEQLEAGRGGVTLTSRSGMTLALTAGSRAELGGLGSSSDPTLRLLDGEVTCHVPPQKPGRTFSVVTADARVVVHGTTFSVAASTNEAGPRTCVRVSEGVVVVHRDGKALRLTAGTEAGCAREPDATPAPQGEAPKPKRIKGGSAPSASSAAPPSELSEQNRLLQAALEAEHRGDVALADRTLRDLLDRYPSSPLANEAKRMRARLSPRPPQP